MRAIALMTWLVVSALVAGCRASGSQKPTAHFQVVREGYGRHSTREPRDLEVLEYSPAVGDTFGPRHYWGPSREVPFILTAVPDTGRAIINYPPLLSVMNGWWVSYYPQGAGTYAGLRPRPPQQGDTLTVTRRWSHMWTAGVDGGDYVSIRLLPGKR